jgi:hypothetical protein
MTKKESIEITELLKDISHKEMEEIFIEYLKNNTFVEELEMIAENPPNYHEIALNQIKLNKFKEAKSCSF